jgi:hypothetical protein
MQADGQLDTGADRRASSLKHEEDLFPFPAPISLADLVEALVAPSPGRRRPNNVLIQSSHSPCALRWWLLGVDIYS